MNITNIRSTLLAIELGSLSAAAKQLAVPVSTVSRRVKELESELGTRIIVRSGRGIQLADEAADTLAKLRNVILAVDDCYDQKAPISRLRVTSTLELTVSLLPRVIPAFHSQYPDVVVELLGDDRITGLIESDFDLAIRAGALNDPNLIGKSLATGGFILVATPALAATITGVEALASTPTVEVSGPSAGLTGLFDGAPFSVRPPVIARVNSFSGSLPCLLAGLACGKVPPHLVQEYLASGQLVNISRVELEHIPVHALYPKRHRNRAMIKAFIAEVDSLFQV